MNFKKLLRSSGHFSVCQETSPNVRKFPECQETSRKFRELLQRWIVCYAASRSVEFFWSKMVHSMSKFTVRSREIIKKLRTELDFDRCFINFSFYIANCDLSCSTQDPRRLSIPDDATVSIASIGVQLPMRLQIAGQITRFSRNMEIETSFCGNRNICAWLKQTITNNDQ